METSMQWLLNLVHWDLFATPTFDPEKPTTPKSRLRKCNAWLNRWAFAFGYVRRDDLPYALRSERGELGGHPHFHILIGGVPSHQVTLDTCFRMKNGWSNGVAQVRIYDPSRNAAAYLTKGRFSKEWSQGANAYELRKYNSREVDFLHLSVGALRIMAHARSVALVDIVQTVFAV